MSVVFKRLFMRSLDDDDSSSNSSSSIDPKQQYGYIPSEWLGIVAIVIFSIILMAEFFEGLFFLLWLQIFPAIATSGEIIGWAFRLKSSFEPLNNGAFIGQLVCLIIAPNFYSAQIYLIFEYFVKVFGHQYAILPARVYGIAFAISDFISLIVQGIGGGIAGSATNNQSQMNTGTYVMLAGIAFQQFSLGVFTALCIQYALCYWKNWVVRDVPDEQKKVIPSALPPWTRWISVIAESFALLWMTLRSIYRLIELADGWSGWVIRTEVYFGVFDFVFMVLCSFSLLLAIEPLYTMKKVTRDAKKNGQLEQQQQQQQQQQSQMHVAGKTDDDRVIELAAADQA